MPVASVTVPNSPYQLNVATDRQPFTPERPATFAERSAGKHAVEYEEVRPTDDLIRSRGWPLDPGDDVWTDCAVASTARTGENEYEYEIALRCRGGIDDVYRIIRPTRASYTVTYRVSDEATRRRRGRR